MELELQLGKKRGHRGDRSQADGGRRLLVLSDLRGGAAREALATRALLRVRQGGDGLDAALASLAPELPVPPSLSSSLAGVGAARALEVTSLDDFHPDTLFRRLPVFRDPPRAPMPAGVTAVGEGDADDVARLLGRRPATAVAVARESTLAPVEDFIGKILAGHVASAPAGAPLDVVALGRIMRAVLHQPAFLSLEASWRALDLLVARADEAVEIWVLDLSRGELTADLLASGATPEEVAGDTDGDRLAASALAQRVLAPPGGRPFSAIVGDFTFGPGADDCALLARLGALAAAARAPFIAGGAPALVGCSTLAGAGDPARWEALAPEDARRWQAFRRGAHAAWIGLVLPRFLARAPYGAKTGGGAIDAFAFEELAALADGGRPVPEQLCWGNSAFLAALALARAPEDDGDGDAEIDDLPFFSFRSQGDVEMYPIAEAFWGQRAADAALSRGLMPVLSARDRNVVRLVRLQSIADPPRALGGDADDDDA
jgi:type VI secretion system protein ImpC